MRSTRPKVLQPLAGRPMLTHVLATLEELGFSSATGNAPIVVVGYGADEVRREIGTGPVYVTQEQQLGTGDATRVGLTAVPRSAPAILLINGDEPLLGVETYQAMLDLQRDTGAAIVLLTGCVRDAHGLGRVIRDQQGRIVELVQERDLTAEQRDIREINFGAYVFERVFLDHYLPRLAVHPGNEYYITDLVRMAAKAGRHALSVTPPEPDMQMGVNDQDQLQRAERYLQTMQRSRPAHSGLATRESHA